MPICSFCHGSHGASKYAIVLMKGNERERERERERDAPEQVGGQVVSVLRIFAQLEGDHVSVSVCMCLYINICMYAEKESKLNWEFRPGKINNIG